MVKDLKSVLTVVDGRIVYSDGTLAQRDEVARQSFSGV